MDQQQLIEAITQEVMRRLHHQPWQANVSDEKIIVIGEHNTPYASFSPEARIADWDEIVITDLPPSAMARLALGIGGTAQEQFILAGLLLGKPVYLFEDGLSYKQFKNTSYKPLYQQYLGYEKQLMNFGVRIIEHWSQRGAINHNAYAKDQQPSKPQMPVGKKVLTGALVQQLASQGIKMVEIAQNTLITPQAVDVLKDYGMTIQRLP